MSRDEGALLDMNNIIYLVKVHLHGLHTHQFCTSRGDAGQRDAEWRIGSE